MPTLADIDLRVKVGGKDALNRFAKEREDFIRDVCIEISTNQEFEWLLETIDITVPATATDWINLPLTYRSTVEVFDTTGAKMTYVSETDYACDRYKYNTEFSHGLYRIRWDKDGGRFQIAFVNGPVTGTTMKVLCRKYLDSPEDFPDFMEEVIVRGALYRFLAFQEGDDLETAMLHQTEYTRLTKQTQMLMDNQVVEKARRVKTNRELYNSNVNNRYRS